jgi:hypothetical protein
LNFQDTENYWKSLHRIRRLFYARLRQVSNVEWLNINGCKNFAICLLLVLLSFSGISHAREMLPITDFYTTPESFASTAQPGDLIRSTIFEGYRLPEGVIATRILYGTSSSSGDLVAGSGVILVPTGDPPAEGWPVIAWAHGTSGADRRCAPSLMSDVFFDYKNIFAYLDLGYAVVAADYAGLGTDYPFAYMDNISMGWDVINSVRAAREALPDLGQKWLAIGHSAGALAVRGVAELEAQINDPSYLGIVSVSGLGDARTPMVFLSEVAPMLAVNIIESVKARYADFNPADILTNKGLEFAEEVKSNCSGPGSPRPMAPQPKGSEVLQDGWDTNAYVDKYFKSGEIYPEKYKGPALVFNGNKEHPPILANDLEATRRLCQQGVKLQFELLADSNHITVLGASIQGQMDWVAGRFAGSEVPENCKTVL